MAVEVLKERGVSEDRILFLNLISSPEGTERFSAKFPKLHVITAFIDQVSSLQTRKAYTRFLKLTLQIGTRRQEVRNWLPPHAVLVLLTRSSYIVPGLGDFGDRFFTM